MNELLTILDKIPFSFRKYCKLSTYFHITTITLLIITILITVNHISTIFFNHKLLILQEQEKTLKQNIQQYYKDLANQHNQQTVIDNFIKAHKILPITSQNSELDSLANIKQAADNTNITIVNIIPTHLEKNDFTLFSNHHNIKIKLCSFAITIIANGNQQLFDFTNQLINQSYYISLDKFEVIQNRNSTLQTFIALKTYCG